MRRCCQLGRPCTAAASPGQAQLAALRALLARLARRKRRAATETTWLTPSSLTRTSEELELLSLRSRVGFTACKTRQLQPKMQRQPLPCVQALSDMLSGRKQLVASRGA